MGWQASVQVACPSSPPLSLVCLAHFRQLLPPPRASRLPPWPPTPHLCRSPWLLLLHKAAGLASFNDRCSDVLHLQLSWLCHSTRLPLCPDGCGVLVQCATTWLCISWMWNSTFSRSTKFGTPRSRYAVPPPRSRYCVMFISIHACVHMYRIGLRVVRSQWFLFRDIESSLLFWEHPLSKLSMSWVVRAVN